jgi:hypothetical protein
MTTTITSPYLVILYIQHEGEKAGTGVARRQFTNEADAEQFAVALLGADSATGTIIGASLFYMNENGTMNTLNEWEF